MVQALLEPHRGDAVRRRDARLLHRHVRRRRDDLGARVHRSRTSSPRSRRSRWSSTAAAAKSRPVAIEVVLRAPPTRSSRSTAARCTAAAGAVLPSKPVVDGEVGRARPLQREVHRHARSAARSCRRTWTGCARRQRDRSSTSSRAAATRGRARSRSRRSGSRRKQIKASDVIWKFFAAHKLGELDA